MILRILVGFFLITLSVGIAYGQQTDPRTILTLTRAAYEALDSYQAEGIVVTDMEHRGRQVKMETAFSVQLMKPRLYLITWETKMPNLPMNQAGAVWNAGEEPHLFMAMNNSYAKLKDDMTALAAATGISSGAAHTIPSLFFQSLLGEDCFARLKDPVLEGTESINGKDCYIISSSSPISAKETFWVSTDDHLLVKHVRLLEPPAGGHEIPELTDEVINETLDSMGMSPTGENRERMKKMMQEAAKEMKAPDLKGTSTQLYLKISKPDLSPADFKFKLPEGAIERESLFDGFPEL